QARNPVPAPLDLLHRDQARDHRDRCGGSAQIFPVLVSRMAQALPKIGLRPFLPADAALLAVIFQASIEELAAEDYSDSQRAAWAAKADDVKAFAERLAG